MTTANDRQTMTSY